MKRSLGSKIMSVEEAVKYRMTVRRDFAFTNGCFDLLHSGHCRLLEQAAQLAPFLVVAVNSDASVRMLKGANRPINPEHHRMEVIAALEAVDVVVLMDDVRCDGLIRRIVPYVWVKGGDYTLETLNKAEVKAAQEVKAEIKILPLLHGRSTTATLAKIASAS